MSCTRCNKILFFRIDHDHNDLKVFDTSSSGAHAPYRIRPRDRACAARPMWQSIIQPWFLSTFAWMNIEVKCLVPWVIIFEIISLKLKRLAYISHFFYPGIRNLDIFNRRLQLAFIYTTLRSYLSSIPKLSLKVTFKFLNPTQRNVNYAEYVKHYSET